MKLEHKIHIRFKHKNCEYGEWLTKALLSKHQEQAIATDVTVNISCPVDGNWHLVLESSYCSEQIFEFWNKKIRQSDDFKLILKQCIEEVDIRTYGYN